MSVSNMMLGALVNADATCMQGRLSPQHAPVGNMRRASTQSHASHGLNPYHVNKTMLQ
jgi:hypothetical protein